MTITEFLLARIAEDEANIKGDWAAGDGGLHIIGSAMHGRMLAECAAKRAIVTEHECLEAGIEVWLDEPDLPNWEGFTPGVYDRDACLACEDKAWPCRTISILAAVYADHPDYRGAVGGTPNQIDGTRVLTSTPTSTTANTPMSAGNGRSDVTPA